MLGYDMIMWDYNRLEINLVFFWLKNMLCVFLLNLIEFL